jgi:hypothetical protein
MNRSQAIQTAVGISGFLVRHFVASIVIVALPCVLWTIAYIGLLLWAVFTNRGIGGPLAYPAGILVILIAATLSCLLLLFPSTALAEWIAKRRGLPIFAQIPISVGILALLCFIYAGVVASSDASQWLQGFSIGFGLLFAAHLLPLGIYWWTMQSGPLVFKLYQRLRMAFGSGQKP